MTYGIGGTCAPGVLMGTAAGGVTPPTAVTLYYDLQHYFIGQRIE